MRKPEGPDTTPQAVQAYHALILWMIPQLDKYPRVRRFTLGERLESTLLLVLERLTEAAPTHLACPFVPKGTIVLSAIRAPQPLAGTGE